MELDYNKYVKRKDGKTIYEFKKSIKKRTLFMARSNRILSTVLKETKWFDILVRTVDMKRMYLFG